MSDSVTVTWAELEALATKLEGMGDQFDEVELAALQTVFALAGDAIAGQDDDEVQGYGIAIGGTPSFGMIMPTDQLGTHGVIITGLRQGTAPLRQYQPGGGGHLFGGATAIE